MSTAPGLSVQQLRVVYDGFVAGDSTRFQVAPGESVGIVGESGSGKSTVLRAICGLAQRQPRGAEQHGWHPYSFSPTRQQGFPPAVQMVFQDPYGST